MPGNETALVDSWISATLLASTDVTDIVSTRVYLDVAPETAAFPFIIYQLQDSSDVRGVGTFRVMSDTLYVVKGVAAVASFALLGDLAEAIDAALNTITPEAVTGGTIIGSVRENPFRLTEKDGGQEFRHLGGIYRIYAQAD